jgi:hypothetical protein
VLVAPDQVRNRGGRAGRGRFCDSDDRLPGALRPTEAFQPALLETASFQKQQKALEGGRLLRLIPVGIRATAKRLIDARLSLGEPSQEQQNSPVLCSPAAPPAPNAGYAQFCLNSATLCTAAKPN